MTWHEGWVILAAFVAVGATFIGIYLTNKSTVKSNELTQKQIAARLRPWFKIEDVVPNYVHYENGTIKSWANHFKYEKDNPNSKAISVKVMISVTNVGLMPAEKLVGKTYHSNKKFSKKDLLKLGKKIAETRVMPNEKLSYDFDIPIDDWERTDKSPYYIGFEYNFNIDSEQRETLANIIAVHKGISELAEEWS